MKTIEPTRVDLYNQHGHVTLGNIRGSIYNSMNGRYTDGDPVKAHVYGEIGARVQFFDDQKFQKGENSLLVVLTRDATHTPVVVDLRLDRLGAGKSFKDGIYKGHDAAGFDWVLFKCAKPAWWEEVLKIVGTVAAVADGLVKLASGQWYAIPGTAIWIFQMNAKEEGSSDNSRVDNVSSILFGNTPIHVWPDDDPHHPKYPQ